MCIHCLQHLAAGGKTKYDKHRMAIEAENDDFIGSQMAQSQLHRQAIDEVPILAQSMPSLCTEGRHRT